MGYREAAVVDGAGHFQLLFRIFLPVTTGVTAALAITPFVSASTTLLWPFLAQTSQEVMNVTAGLTRLREACGTRSAGETACR